MKLYPPSSLSFDYLDAKPKTRDQKSEVSSPPFGPDRYQVNADLCSSNKNSNFGQASSVQYNSNSCRVLRVIKTTIKTCESLQSLCSQSRGKAVFDEFSLPWYKTVT